MINSDSAAAAPRFALLGAAGFVARRHLEAIRTVGGTLVAACDVNDSVGVLDSYHPHARFFLDPDAFATFLRQPGGRVNYVSVCTPSDLHEEHCALALQAGANVVLEKPPVLDPGGISRLIELEQRTGRIVHPVLQLRYHPAIEAFRAEVARRPGRRLNITASYVTRRGPWFQLSWKGDPRRSGTIVYNFGIHLFDVLTWIFGPATEPVTAWMDEHGTRAGGMIRFAGADARWLLSSRAEDLPTGNGQTTACRQFLIDGRVAADFSGDYSGLHQRVYEEVVAGRGHRMADAHEATVLVDQILGAVAGTGHPSVPSSTSASA